ncbi:uncharacterized protein DFL_000942 [Arthrobotrys flagrans]|uniref:CAP20 n=1 Tax=Arthrobotrys flagrans TaxID=97331 RepID=A0A437AFR1_ARTFL|nr:hypothetical protein DFL_000942 [Arthrobotrys flagrans]
MTTNGETQSNSAFLNHLVGLPVVSDGVSYFKGHPVGQRSLSISQSVYDTFVKPFSPYIAKANVYAGPYVTKADKFANSGLDQLEERVPIVKEPTAKLKERITNLLVYHTAHDALAFGNKKKDYALKVYNDEYNKASNGQKSLVSAAKAGISTTFILSTQTIGWIAGYLTAKKEEVQETANETVKEKTASE